ncbi:fumarylacetoacetate hydrolase family protein [Thalassotalea sp. ND16A]|uniref:fumarylacetoacetate hydrolase family protein n=1 Tax=Thalassotalea sp. ND16A TaxID=1535422 RepID=UPI00051A2D0E|nr:fumarylacetoacetate hydrolase family protein [Thalassotalea sp. ND16A]KGJ99177.1 Ureidoglycolate lyase [Thalassotalea sp. ND16A]
MTKYGLATYQSNADSNAVTHTAIVLDNEYFDLQQAYKAVNQTVDTLPAWVVSISEAVQQWQSVNADIEAFAEIALTQKANLTPLAANIKVMAPFKPTTIFGTASNYHEHAAEMQTVLAAKEDSSPYVFMKATTSVVGTKDDVILPPETKKLDWEVELGVVIGKPARRVKAEDALDYIAGYTVVNDISARDLNRRSDYPFKHDWFRGKSWDTFCPMGPVFVPKSGIEDPHKVKLALFLNDKQMQDGNTSELIWDLFEQIEYLSSILTLQPGDVIMTGTPAGVGKGIGLFLKPGDVLRASAEGVGEIINTITAEQL